MSKRQFKGQASSSRVDPGIGFGGFGTVFAGSTLSYLSEPPNLSSITDANVVVAFKNLLKKDSTTKAKGLEDLRSYIQSHPYEQDGGVEQPVLEAWVKLYPRVSIDNSRRVRELSHILQFELLKSARKRMEKFIPSVVGSWLAGTYDKDRPVARAASDGVTSFLDSKEKLLSFWRKCQPQILDYAQEAIRETPQTLSDERNTSPDDLLAKFNRVMGASMALVNNLLLKLSEKDVQKHQEAYESFLSDNKLLWGFISSNDSVLRRTSAQLLSTCLEKESTIIEKDLQFVSHAFIDEGLRASQSGSALQLLQALNKLTKKFPQVWISAYKGKKPALTRLCKFVERGSQSGPPEFWQSLTSLIIILPPGVLPTDADGAMDLLKAERDGISSREESRINVPAAWKSYFDITKHIMIGLPDSKDIDHLSCNALYPLFEQFLFPAPANSAWSMGNNTVALAKAFNICWNSENTAYPQALADEWKRLAENLTAKMLTSLLEQSKDYTKSQAAIIAEAHRWFALQGEIVKSAKSTLHGVSLESRTTFLSSSSFSLIMKALEVLRNRNGKPYGAAGVLEASLRMTPELINATPTLDQAIVFFLENDVPKLILSPSFEYLIASLYAFKPLPGHGGAFESIWQAAMDSLLASSDSDRKSKALQGLISNHATSSLAQQDLDLQEYLFKHTSQLMLEQPAYWAVFESATSFDNFSSETVNRVVSFAVDHLNGESVTVDGSLRVLEYLAQKKPQLLQDVHVNQLTIMTRLLALTESRDSITISRANALKARIEGQNNPAADTDQFLPPALEVIRENLNTAGPQSLAIDTLVRQAQGFINANKSRITLNILPDTKRWFEALQPSLGLEPNPTLSMISSVGSAISLVQISSNRTILRPDRDISGYSNGLRMALYTSKLVSGLEDLNSLDLVNQVEILWLLILTQQLASDQLGLEENNKLWSSLADSAAESQIQDFAVSSYIQSVASANSASTWCSISQDGNQSVVQKLVARLIETSRGSSLLAFYAAQALSNLISTLVETNGWKSSSGDEWLSSQGIFKASTPSTFISVGILFGLQEVLGSSKLLNNLSNQLISDITGASPMHEKTLSSLILLNASLTIYEPGNLPVAQNRLVFAVKQIISWMTKGEQIYLPVAAAAFKCLQVLLFSIKDVYGPYWQATLDFCINLWKKPAKGNLDELLPALQASLKLVNILRGLQEPNDDLVDALSDSEESLSQGLLTMLRLPRTKENQPWRIFDELLFRNIIEIPLKHIKNTSEIYPSVASEFYFIQLAAFYTLNQAISAAQEQISVDVLLEKTDARLPEELLSLLLDAPIFENFPDEILVQFPPPVRTYLFSWQLVFAAYPQASHKVRSDYSEVLKSENYISPLLDFIFDVLGHSDAQPINLEKAGFTSSRIQQYDLRAAEAEKDEKKMQWILINLYYLCLKYAPNLAKTWWMNCKSKQTRIAVESWTEKYFSPLVIGDTLDEVVTWAEQQGAPTDDEKELLIKVSKKSREVYAGYEVDDMQMQIVIRLPAIYPLEGVKVDGINRVAVAERKWQNWLMITQGVITFSNGSIIDGLIAFKKNVTGALKGQTECAICYSIISSDKKMPDKRCQTCKNLFHSSCLFKWFASSNQSTCPLCRNPFNYGMDFASRANRRGGPE